MPAILAAAAKLIDPRMRLADDLDCIVAPTVAMARPGLGQSALLGEQVAAQVRRLDFAPPKPGRATNDDDTEDTEDWVGERVGDYVVEHVVPPLEYDITASPRPADYRR